MIPVSWTNGDYDAEKYKSEVKPDCDWVFKGGIPLGSTKDSVDKALGKPYSEISDNNGNYNCGYCISDKFEPITQADYAKIQNGEKSDKPTYLGFAMFGENKLIAFAMAYGSVPEVMMFIDEKYSGFSEKEAQKQGLSDLGTGNDCGYNDAKLAYYLLMEKSKFKEGQSINSYLREVKPYMEKHSVIVRYVPRDPQALMKKYNVKMVY